MSPVEDDQIVDLNGKPNEEEEEINTENVPKTPSTAERRKLFENRSNSKENDAEDGLDGVEQSNNFERMSLQRSSIAERRKLYENKTQDSGSIAITEKASESPVMLRRKDSFKMAKNITEDTPLKEENNRKSVPFARQQSVPQCGGKKAEAVATPTPKRTSTVFGKFFFFNEYILMFVYLLYFVYFL